MYIKLCKYKCQPLTHIYYECIYIYITNYYISIMTSFAFFEIENVNWNKTHCFEEIKYKSMNYIILIWKSIAKNQEIETKHTVSVQFIWILPCSTQQNSNKHPVSFEIVGSCYGGSAQSV